MIFGGTNRKHLLIAGFIAAVLTLLVASLLILSYRSRAIFAHLNAQADRAITLADKIQAGYSREVAAIVGFQATGQANYIDLYQEQAQSIDGSLVELEPLTTLLGSSVQRRFKELKSTIDEWHRDPKTRRLATQRLSQHEFRELVFDRLFIVRRAHEMAGEFNNAVVGYEWAQRARMERTSSLFSTLAIVFGPLALFAMALIAYILRRLGATTSYWAALARDEQALRQAGSSMTGGLTVDDVLRRIIEAAAVTAQTEGVFIETVDARKNEILCVAAYGVRAPARGIKTPLEGSILQEVLKTEQPQIIDNLDIERNRRSPIGELARTGQGYTLMVVPLIAENEGLGAMFLARSRKRPFTPAEFPRVRILADMAAIAMQRALTLERVRKMETRARFSAKTLKTLTSSLDYRATLKSVAGIVVSEIADFCIIYLVDKTRIHIAELAHRDPANRDIVQQLQSKYAARPDRQDSVEQVIRTGKPILAPELTDELVREHSIDNEHYDLLRRLNLKSAILAPLTADSEIFGTIALLRSDGKPYEADDLRFAERIASYAALAIRNARLYAQAGHAIHARDEVLRVVSHDLRSPLNNIQLSANLLSTPSIPDERRQDLLRMISRSAKRMNGLIEDLIDISRLREGETIPIKVQPENPADIVEEACAEVAFQALAKRIHLRCNKPSTLPRIKADRRRILQVLYNLLDNALKFTPEGGAIFVSCNGSDRGVRFCVRDTGPGIDSKDVNRIFDLFWQAEPRAHLGSGLGLAIARAIVEQHNGRIWADSKSGLGTRISFTLPLANVDEAPAGLKAA